MSDNQACDSNPPAMSTVSCPLQLKIRMEKTVRSRFAGNWLPGMIRKKVHGSTQPPGMSVAVPSAPSCRMEGQLFQSWIGSGRRRILPAPSRGTPDSCQLRLHVIH